MTRKQYTKEFKLEALKLAEKIGVPRAAEDLGVGQSLLYRWRKAAQGEGKDAFRGHGRLTERDEELRKLHQEVDALRSYRHLRGELVFCDVDGSMLTESQCRWVLWHACDRADIRRIGWHCLRHTVASHLVMRGASLKSVQELLGHADIRMTMRYAHLSSEAQDAAVQLLDRGTIGAHSLGEMKNGN